MLRRLDSPTAAASVAALLAGLTLLVALAGLGWRPGALVRAGDRTVDRTAVPDDLVVERNSTGYDGEFVYALSLDPFTRTRTVHGITIDNPPYRQQRIALPFVTWAIHRTTRVPVSVVLMVVNAAAVVAAAWFGARWAAALRRHVLWGVLVGLPPALVMALVRDLTEPMAWAALVAGLWWWRSGRLPWATAAFCLAVLTRETSLAVLAGLGAWTLLGPGGGSGSARIARSTWLLAPLGAAVAVQLWLLAVWDKLPVRSNEGNLGTPFAGTLRHLVDGWQWAPTTKDDVLRDLWVVERVGLLAMFVLVLMALWRTSAPAWLCAAWVPAALLALSATWNRDIQFLRAAHEAIGVGVLILLGVPKRAATVALSGVAAASVASAAVYAVTL